MTNRVEFNTNKGFRLLNMNDRLKKGEILNKSSLAEEYNVTEKTIQRDIDDLRAYIADSDFCDSKSVIKYDKIRNGYYIVNTEREGLTNQEVLAVCKILLESRAFCKEELNTLISKLIMQVAPGDRKLVESTIRNEQFHYIPLKHNKKLLSIIWMLSAYISNQEIINISYTRKDGIRKDHNLKPVAIMFSEYYFYLIAYMACENKGNPTVFRIDRIEKCKSLNEKFQIPYKDRFDESEFRKRVQFMYSGDLQKLVFEYSGDSIESVLDRLPSAEIISDENGIYTVKAETFGEGIYMWIKSQGNAIKIIKEKI